MTLKAAMVMPLLLLQKSHRTLLAGDATSSWDFDFSVQTRRVNLVIFKYLGIRVFGVTAMESWGVRSSYGSSL